MKSHLLKYSQASKKYFSGLDDKVSLFVTGSWTHKNLNDAKTDRDRDIVLIYPSDYSLDRLSTLRNCIFKTFGINGLGDFSFQYYYCDHCSLTQSKRKFHLLSFESVKWLDLLNSNSWILYNWWKNHELLFGYNPFFDRVISPKLAILLDDQDGIPSFLSDIEAIIISKDPEIHSFEYEKTAFQIKKRLEEIDHFFNLDSGIDDEVFNTLTCEKKIFYMHEKCVHLISLLQSTLK